MITMEEIRIRAKIALAVACLLPFGMGLGHFLDVGGGGMAEAKVFLQPFPRQGDLGEVEANLTLAFEILEESYGADSHRLALAYLRRGQLHLYRLELPAAARDLREALERGGCNPVSPEGEISPARPRTEDDGGLSSSDCAATWRALGEARLEDGEVDEGVRYLRAEVEARRDRLGTGPEILQRAHARSYQRAVENLAAALRKHGRSGEAVALEAGAFEDP